MEEGRERRKKVKKGERRKEEWEGDDNDIKTSTTRPGICFSSCHSLPNDLKIQTHCFIVSYIFTNSRGLKII